MKRISILWIISSLSLIVIAANGIIDNRHLDVKYKANHQMKGFAVVELFTSEGCSSCPPADDLVAKIQKENNDLPVYILAFHVDYWNNLGWKDSFSSSAFSKRQNQYADWLNLRSVYTPQVIVNGRKEFVGSDEGSLRNAIKAGLQKVSSAQVTLNDVQITKQQVNLKYQTEGVATHRSLILAVIQKSATTEVKRGENGGRTLSHVQIVRRLQTIDLDKRNDGNSHFDLPEGLNPENSELIAFLQNNSTGEIITATKVRFGSSSPINK
jgi:hypothetical protein